MNIYIDLFLTFFKIGICTFGGGYAMLPIIKREIVNKKKWAQEEEIMDYYAIGQCTPGVIAVNTATFIGYKKAKVLGAMFSTMGVVTPSIIIIIIIAAFIQKFAEYAVVQKALSGISVVVCALVLKSIIELCRKGIRDWLGIAVLIISFAANAFLGISPIIIVISAAALGIFADKTGIKK